MNFRILFASVCFWTVGVFFSFCFAQKKNNWENKLLRIDGDTLFANISNDEKISERPASYVQKWWPENNKFHALLFSTTEGYLVRENWFSNREATIKEGICIEYHKNGMIKDSGLYINNKQEGTFLGWYENGMEHHVCNFKNGLPVDTCYTFRENGSLSQITITDNLGNGKFQDYYESQKVKLIGRLQNGQRNGIWQLKREDGTRKMQLKYQMDSLVQSTCFKEDGETVVNGVCIFEKPAQFPNGIEGWKNFLQKQLQYPEIALEQGIQGVVKIQFVVKQDGTLDDMKILSSPHPILSKEVLRLMNKSPKWEPAIQYNEPVIYRHIQAVTFAVTKEVNTPTIRFNN